MRLVLILALAAAALPAPAQDAPHKQPIATLTIAYTYLWADQGNHYRSNLNGWNVRPAVPLGRGYTVFFSSTNYYGKNLKGSLNSHGYTGGVSKQVFATAHLKPSIFLESGDVRASSAGVITNELLIATGAAFSIPLRPWVSLTVLPAEYIFLYPHSDWRNDYNAKLGLTFPIGHR